MNSQALHRAWSVAAAMLVVVALPAWAWGPRAVMGVLAGGVWNLASLWCLTRLLNAWLGPQPSKHRAIWWLLAKLFLLSVLVFGILRAHWVSLVGFGIGFTVVLLVVVGSISFRAQQMAVGRSHGR